MKPTITLLVEGEAIPVTNLFDADGDDVEAWDEAFAFVAGPRSDGMWLSGLTEDHRRTPLS